MTTPDQPKPGWTLVLRRQPARILAGRAEGGYTDAFEIICPECGDRPDLDYREVSPELRQVRGPYPLAAGVTAYERHRARHHERRGPAATAATAAGAGAREVQAEPSTRASTPAGPESPGLSLADRADRAEELLDWVLASILDVGVILQANAGPPHGTSEMRITEAAGRLDDVVREVRNRLFAEPARGARSGSARSSPPKSQARARAVDHRAWLRDRLAQTARALQQAAADAAALLEQQADLAGRPGRIDYPTEIKRWRAFADQAEHMAKRWEQPSSALP
jgi:hypothetical protein